MTRTLQQVGAIDPGSPHGDEQLARTGHRLRHLGDGQDIRITGLRDDHSTHDLDIRSWTPVSERVRSMANSAAG
ncbi:hypothetical protein CSO01_16040 [Cellulomonas soli]|uniref:Uncharacterized protein n=1 Tax=Cellulomonas soli TaxID=931535 RepID=A0A512PCF6_9CELL|nr:hypothetical protein CSO01_16040 [Cellulomonas soli]